MTGLIGWWPLNETQGDQVNDLSGNQNHGGLKGEVIKDVAGLSGLSAYRFNGDEDVIEIGEGVDEPDKLTVQAWIKTDKTHQSYTYIFINTTDDSIGDSVFALGFRGAEPYGITFSVNGEHEKGVIENEFLDDGRWHHLVGVYDGNNVIFYIDGKIRNKYESLENEENGLIGIGGDPFGNRPERSFEGNIFDTRIYNRALSPSEVERLYYMGSRDLHKISLSNGNDEGAVSRWKFGNNGDESTAIDFWGDNDGEINGASFTNKSVRGTEALRFENNDYVNCGDFSDTFISDPGINGEITFSAWFKRFGNSTSYILSSGSQTSSTGIHFRQDTVRVQTREKTWGYTYGDSPLNVWIHYVATWDGEKLYAYKNGSLQAVVSSSSESEDDEESLLTIGAPNNSLDSDHNMNGIIDDVRIFDRALESWEVFELYRWGSLGIDMRRELVNKKGGRK